MPIRPILATLRRHKLTVGLLLLQVAFTCAIVCNAAFLIVQRLERVSVPSGLDETALSVVDVGDLPSVIDPLSVHQADLAALRAIPGVESATMVSNLPLTGSSYVTGGCGSLAAKHEAEKTRSGNAKGCSDMNVYEVGHDALRALGLKLVAGRDFRPGEYASDKGSAGTPPMAVIVSRALAKRLFPSTEKFVGRSVYAGVWAPKGQGIRVVGVVAHLQRGQLAKAGDNDLAMLLPSVPAGAYASFVLHSKPSARMRVMKAAIAVLNKRVPSRNLGMDDAQTYSQIRAHYFERDTSMIGMLLAAALGLLLVTAIGIGGLANFWVGQRTRTIGIRRAIGATRGDILRYFQTENFLIVTAGVVLGVILAVVLSLLLMQHYALPRLPLWYLVIGAIALWILGQLAVLAPALRAANVPPVVATRSV